MKEQLTLVLNSFQHKIGAAKAKIIYFVGQKENKLVTDTLSKYIIYKSQNMYNLNI